MATAGAFTKISVARAVVGLLSLVLGVILVGNGVPAGVAPVVCGTLLLANAPCTVFFFIDMKGDTRPVTVSALDRRKVEQFLDQVHRRMYDPDRERDE